MVRLENTARTKEAKSIMTMPQLREGTPAPFFRHFWRLALRLAEGKDDRRSLGPGRENERLVIPSVAKGIGK